MKSKSEYTKPIRWITRSEPKRWRLFTRIGELVVELFSKEHEKLSAEIDAMLIDKRMMEARIKTLQEEIDQSHERERETFLECLRVLKLSKNLKQ